MKRIILMLVFLTAMAGCKKNSSSPQPKYDWLPFTSESNVFYSKVHTPLGGSATTVDHNAYSDESTLRFGECFYKINGDIISVQYSNISMQVYQKGAAQDETAGSGGTTYYGKTVTASNAAIKAEAFISEGHGIIFVKLWSYIGGSWHLTDNYKLK